MTARRHRRPNAARLIGQLIDKPSGDCYALGQLIGQ
jgi:hypothetical protein